MSSYNVREAVAEDALDIQDIYNISVVNGFSTGHTEPIELCDVLDWLELMTPQRPFWVLEIENRVVAGINADDFHGLPIFANCAEIGVYVLPEFQRQGLADILLEHLEIELKSFGTSHIVALIFHENQASLHLFYKHEFEPWGLYPKVAKVDGNTHDIHVLGKAILV